MNSGGKFVLCYICGGKFVERSLAIHEPQCLQKWKNENTHVPKHQRKPLPVKPAVVLSANELVPCDGCGRTFAAERLPVHQRVCKGGQSTPKKTNATPATKPKLGTEGTGELSQSAAGLTSQKDAASVKISAEHEPRARESESKSGPKTVVCYICLREFGSHSISIHEPKCLQKWTAENAKLPKAQRRPPPKKPGGPLTNEQANELYWENTRSQLVPCDNCARRFDPGRLVIHQRMCKPVQDKRTAPAVVNHPPVVICYICGGKFGTRSISIHEPQCLTKWKLQNAKLPSDQRRPVPKKPETRSISASGRYDADTVGDMAYQTIAANFVPCENCGRTFNPNRLAVHQRSCNNI